MTSKQASLKWRLRSVEDISDLHKLSQFCHSLAKELKGHEIILLDGPMAAGKSELVLQVLKILMPGVASRSPSYALHHQYRQVSTEQGRQIESVAAITVDHWDLYRLANEDELESSGFWDLMAASNMVFIEWSERLNVDWLPRDRRLFKISIELDGDRRTLSFFQAA